MIESVIGHYSQSQIETPVQYFISVWQMLSYLLDYNILTIVLVGDDITVILYNNINKGVFLLLL